MSRLFGSLGNRELSKLSRVCVGTGVFLKAAKGFCQ